MGDAPWVGWLDDCLTWVHARGKGRTTMKTFSWGRREWVGERKDSHAHKRQQQLNRRSGFFGHPAECQKKKRFHSQICFVWCTSTADGIFFSQSPYSTLPLSERRRHYWRSDFDGGEMPPIPSSLYIRARGSCLLGGGWLVRGEGGAKGGLFLQDLGSVFRWRVGEWRAEGPPPSHSPTPSDVRGRGGAKKKGE